jgi:dTDP-4-amino-4,6-dideoxygalactose transaminase
MIHFLNLFQQYESIQTEIDDAIQSVIRDSAFVGGQYVAEFERQFAEYQQAAHCIGVGNGTDALEIAIDALELPAHSDIIVPGNSFIASAEAVTRTGHRVVFCDADSNDYTIHIEEVRHRLTDNTAAIIAVHLYRQPCDMAPLLEFAKQHRLRVIEDCAQAHGAEYQGRRVGSLGDIGAFSFYPGKNLGAYGDGGAITTNDAKLAKKCRMLANHGRLSKYDHEFEGRNSRLDGLQAAILSVKLKHLDDWLTRRAEIAMVYDQAFKPIEQIITPTRRSDSRHSYHLYVIRTEKRHELKKYLAMQQIQTGIHYPIPLPKLNAYRYLHQADEPMFIHQVGEQLLSLPIGEHLTVEDAERVGLAVSGFPF